MCVGQRPQTRAGLGRHRDRAARSAAAETGGIAGLANRSTADPASSRAFTSRPNAISTSACSSVRTPSRHIPSPPDTRRPCRAARGAPHPTAAPDAASLSAPGTAATPAPHHPASRAVANPDPAPRRGDALPHPRFRGDRRRHLQTPGDRPQTHPHSVVTPPQNLSNFTHGQPLLFATVGPSSKAWKGPTTTGCPESINYHGSAPCTSPVHPAEVITVPPEYAKGRGHLRGEVQTRDEDLSRRGVRCD